MRHSSGIGVLDKSVLVLRCAATRPVSLAELVAASGLPRATAHRLASALEVHRLLRRDPAGRWRPGPALRELSSDADDPLLAAAGPVLERLRESTAESTQLYVRQGGERICVAVAERAHGLRDTVPVGARLPMSAGSAAQVLLAFSTAEDIRTALATAAFTGRTLAEVRRRGWAASVAEREPGVASVSAAVRDHAGTVIAAVSVSGPIERLGRRPGVSLGPAVLAAAAALTRRL